MLQGESYWNRRRISRRGALRGAGAVGLGLTGAALVGCGEEDDPALAESTGGQSGSTPTTGGSGAQESPGQVRVAPGMYEGHIAPTQAEENYLQQGRRGGTLRVRYLDPPHMDFNRTLSCTVNTTMDYTKNKLVRAVFGPRANPALIDIEPDLAESWEVNEDATKYTFNLHRGAKFQNVAPVDGREFTAEDVRASVERYQGGGSQSDVWSPVESIEMPDDYTVVFNLDQPFVDFPRNIAAWSHMDAREVVDDDEFMRSKAIGTGPFIQEEWTNKERSVFSRNPDYFEEGLPFLDGVLASVIEDLAVQRTGFETNNLVDWSTSQETEAHDVLAAVDDAVYAKVPRAQGANTGGYHFQMQNPTFQDERVRRAFSLAIDRVEYDLAQFQGDGGGFSLGPIAWPVLYDTMPTQASQGEWYQYDPEKASQLLQAAGYSSDSKVRVDAPAWYKRRDYANFLVPMYGMVPEMDFQFREVDNPTAVSMLNDRNFDDTMNITWGPPAYSVDQAVYPWYLSDGGLNFNNVDDAEMDRLLKAQRGEIDPDAQKELWHQIEDRVFDQVWDVFFPETVFRRELFHNYMVNYRVHGIGNFTCYANGQIRSVWLDEGAPA